MHFSTVNLWKKLLFSHRFSENYWNMAFPQIYGKKIDTFPFICMKISVILFKKIYNCQLLEKKLSTFGKKLANNLQLLRFFLQQTIFTDELTNLILLCIILKKINFEGNTSFWIILVGIYVWFLCYYVIFISVYFILMLLWVWQYQ